MITDFTARETEKLLKLMNVLLEGPLIDHDIVSIVRKLETNLLEENKRTAEIAMQYLRASLPAEWQPPLFTREKPLPEA
jgi:hypothetical protein